MILDVKGILRTLLYIFLTLALAFFTIRGVGWMKSEEFPRFLTKSTDLKGEDYIKTPLITTLEDTSYQIKYSDEIIFREDTEYDYYKFLDSVEIKMNSKDNTIKSLMVTGDDLKTKRGVSIGDTRIDIISTYGSNNYSRNYDGWDSVSYIDKENKLVLRFIFAIHGVGSNRLGRYDIIYLD